jgi:hypothetical protein
MTVDTFALKHAADDAAESASIIADIVKSMPADDRDTDVSEASPDQVTLAAPGAPADPTAAPTAAEVIKAAEGTVAKVAAATGEGPAPKEPEDTRVLIRALEREGMIRDREAVLDKREAALRAREEQAKAGPDLGSLRDRLMDDPAGVLRELGADPAYVARVVTADVLGDKAPADLRASTETARLRAQMARQRAELEQMIRSRDHEAERARVRTEARSYAASKRDGASEHPTVDTVAASDPGYVEEAIFDEIARDAAARAGREPDGRLMTPTEAAKRLEARWAKIAGARPAPAETQTTTSATSPQNPATPAPARKVAAAPPIPKNPPRRARRAPAYYEAQDGDDDSLAYALDVLRGRSPAS